MISYILIDSYNSALTPVGPLNIDIIFAQDMSFDLDTNILYLAAYTVVPVEEGALYTCNVATGATIKVGTFENKAELDCFAIPYASPPPPPTFLGPDSGVVGDDFYQEVVSNHY